MDTVTLEAHELDRITDQWCDHCCAWTLTERHIAIVNTVTLETVARYVLSDCPCGTDTITR